MRALRIAGVVVGLTVLVPAVMAARAVQKELASARSEHHAVLRPAGDAWVGAAVDVALGTPKGSELRGWFHPSSNGAAVVMADGYGADRTQLLPEAHALSDAGFGVLVFDQPGNGESTGQRRREEGDFLRRALDFLSSAPGVDPGELGAYGFSRGASSLADVAATDARLRGVVLAACFTDDAEFIRHFGGQGPLTGVPAVWAARLEGFVLPHPLLSLPLIGPRAVFLIAGDEDPIVPYHSAELLYAAASGPRELWIVHGVGHGGYAKIAGEEYTRRLVSFFDRTLLGRADR